MTALEYFRLLAPEFAAVLDATVTIWLDMAGDSIITDCLSAERAARAQAVYAAHLMKVTSNSAGGGQSMGVVTSEKEGDLQRDFGAISHGDTWLGQTPYGQQYLDITRVCAGATIMTRVAR